MTEAQPRVTGSEQGQQTTPPLFAMPEPDVHYMQKQVFLLEDTVLTMSMAVTTISSAMRRWEKVLLPMMAGFIVLAGYGFYLIYHLTYDIGMMSNNMAQMTMTVDRNMTVIAQEIRGIQKEVKIMTDEVVTMDDHILKINETMLHMNESMSKINDSVAQMAMSTSRMGTDLWDLNRSISGPMSTINNVAPWRMLGGRKEPPPPPQAVPPSSYPYYYGIPAPQTAQPQQQPAQTPPAVVQPAR
jgi:uncharacterized protein YoxC